jgi:hypothetical protein
LGCLWRGGGGRLGRPQGPIDVVMLHGRNAPVVVPGPRLRATVPAHGGRGGGLRDCVPRRGVRHDVGQRADRDERAGSHPPVYPGQATNSDVARNLCSVAPHP